MKDLRKTKFVVFTATVFTAILLCCTVYAGAYTVPSTKIFPQSTTAASPDKKKTVDQTVVYENVTMYHPSAGEDAYPYVHDIRTNNTTKTIVKTEVGMLAYDKNGNPLKLNWYSLDTDEESSYDYSYDWDSTQIMPGQTDNVDGGWSFNILGADQNVKKIAYVLYCDRKITFSDGTVWENPKYEAWHENYSGKKVSVKLLSNYYPYVQTIE
ncbi:hypothetical protein D3C78_1114590 [compost metagenome]